MITIQTRLDDPASGAVLARCAELFARLERRLFVALYVNEEPLAAAKRRFIAEHAVSARQFNALHNQVSAKVDSWWEGRKLNLSTVRDQIARTEQKLTNRKRLIAVHQLRRRLGKLTARETRIQRELAAKVPAICFGSRKLFRAQFNLETNGYASHAEWQAAWRAQRAASFFVLGSADETCGNQSCQYRDGQVHLRLPGALGGGTVAIPATFAYRQADLLAALTPKMQMITRGPRAGTPVERGDAISYRFVRKADGRWFVFASFATVAAPITTQRALGCVGVDLNPWGLAVTRIDRCGNLVDHFDVPWLIEGRSQSQIKAAIGDAVRTVVLYAQRHGVPVAIERLDFAEAKQQNRSTGLNRMLSAFAYAAFAQMIRGRCARDGLELIEINPAFTSVIGRGKFAAGYGLSAHRAAAGVIARRALHFGEKLRTRSAGTALALPVRNRARHVWHNWARWAKAQRTHRSRSTQPKGSRTHSPRKTGESIPDPSPPNDLGRAGNAMPLPSVALLTSGATPQASREHCSHGVVTQPSRSAQKAV